MTRRLKLAMAFALCLVLAACAAGGVESANAAHQGLASQFLLGVWHGIIAPVTLLVEILHKLFPRRWRLRFELLEDRTTPSINPANPLELDGNVTTTTAHDWDQIFAVAIGSIGVAARLPGEPFSALRAYDLGRLGADWSAVASGTDWARRAFESAAV